MEINRNYYFFFRCLFFLISTLALLFLFLSIFLLDLIDVLALNSSGLFVFNKLPVIKSDLDKIKNWIDLFSDSLLDTEDENEQ